MQVEIDEQIFGAFVFYGAMSMLKMLLMSAITAFYRITTKTFANEEDSAGFKGKVATNAAVERVRRAHMNDLENVVPFCFVGYIFVIAGAGNYEMSLLLFRIFFYSRVGHTICYLLPLPQPSRFLCCFSGYLVTIYMVLRVLAVL